MGIFESLFGAQKQTTTPNSPATPTPQATAPGNIPAGQVESTMVPGNGVVPASALTPNPSPDPAIASPLDGFKDFWDTDPQLLANSKPKPIFNVDPKKLAEAAAKNDFSKVVSPEMLQKIQAGGPEAAKVLIDAMNQMSQKSFGDSAQASVAMIEAALEKQREMFEAKLPSLIKSQTVSESLRNESPVFSHPAAAPVLEMFQKQAAIKFPTSTAAEHTQMAKDWLKSLSEAGTPKPAAPANKPGEYDWGKFFDSP